LGWVVSATPRPLYPRGREPEPIVQEAGWAPRTGIDRCGEYRLPPGFYLRTSYPVKILLYGLRYCVCISLNSRWVTNFRFSVWKEMFQACCRAVIPNLGYAYHQGYEPGHLGVREKKELNNGRKRRIRLIIGLLSLQLQHRN